MTTLHDIKKAESGYVEFPGGTRCGNCTYLVQASICAKFGYEVSADNGCCNAWKNKDAVDFSKQLGIMPKGYK